MNLPKTSTWACLILASFQIFNCEETDPPEKEPMAGELVRAELIHQYSVLEMNQILLGLGLPEPVTVQSDIKAVKLTYFSSGRDGELLQLTGALLLPLDDLSHSLLSIQHGTVTKRNEVASVNPLNSSAGVSALLTSAHGYITLVPDFAGFGNSSDPHPYLHGELLAMSVIDMIRAARRYCAEENININEKLFLTGYSEGGYATLATQKLMESAYLEEFTLTAVCPMAGPYDLDATAQLVLQGEHYNWPAYIGFMFVAYNQIYGFNNLDEVFQAPYSEQMTSFYQGDYSFFEINDHLPLVIEDFILNDFIQAYLSGTETTYRERFIENSLLDWQAIAPLRFFHGMEDTTVPYSVAVATVEALQGASASDIDLIGIPDADHETAGMPAVQGMLAWFSSY